MVLPLVHSVLFLLRVAIKTACCQTATPLHFDFNPLSCNPAKTPEKMAENRRPATKSQVWPEDRKRKVQHRTSETRGTTAPIFAIGPDRNADVCYELWAFLYGLFLT